MNFKIHILIADFSYKSRVCHSITHYAIYIRLEFMDLPSQLIRGFEGNTTNYDHLSYMYKCLLSHK